MRSLETGTGVKARNPRLLVDIYSVPPGLDPDQGAAETRFEREFEKGSEAIKTADTATTSRSRRWLGPTLAGVAAALGAALWNHKKVRMPSWTRRSGAPRRQWRAPALLRARPG